jgi:hypothetical protein
VSPGQEQATPELPLTWPASTSLFFPPGSTRVMMTLQRPLIRTIIQDGIEELRALLIIREAFPNGITTVSYIRHALITAAENRGHTASSIHMRLIQDEDYGHKLTPLVSSPFTLRTAN